MTEQPNIKKEILEYVLDHDRDEGGAVNLREFARDRGYSEQRVARKSDELYPLIECGVSPMLPWIQHGQRDAAEEQLAEWSE